MMIEVESLNSRKTDHIPLFLYKTPKNIGLLDFEYHLVLPNKMYQSKSQFFVYFNGKVTHHSRATLEIHLENSGLIWLNNLI